MAPAPGWRFLGRADRNGNPDRPSGCPRGCTASCDYWETGQHAPGQCCGGVICGSEDHAREAREWERQNRYLDYYERRRREEDRKMALRLQREEFERQQRERDRMADDAIAKRIKAEKEEEARKNKIRQGRKPRVEYHPATPAVVHKKMKQGEK